MFITLEGPEGAGKSTLGASLKDWLSAEGFDVLLTREPGSGEVGRRIREILLHGADLDAKSELLLFLADRAQHVATEIRPHLERGGTVLCDRYVDSTIVYQGYARGLEMRLLRELNDFATDRLLPELTLLLDLEPAIGLARLMHRDRLDSEPIEFHERVRRGFLTEAARQPDRFAILPAGQDSVEVFAMAQKAVASRIARRNAN